MRAFNAQAYVVAKVAALNKFFLDNQLDSVVLGISGGVDSALAFLLYLRAAAEPGSPIKLVCGLSMPIYGHGTSGQSETESKGLFLLNSLLYNDKLGYEKPEMAYDKAQYVRQDLTAAYDAMVASSNVPGSDAQNAWSNGQMAFVLRTPALYHRAAILQASGYRSVVSGTTNRDEGSYIGFFGKASDGMVDVQPIGDIHKSEVYKVAKVLGVPSLITDDAPMGDVWDKRTDEEMIGAPYWFLQEYLESKCAGNHAEFCENGYVDLKISQETHKLYIENIERLHNTNKHKYQVGSPAHFIDVMERKVIGGW